MPGLCRNLPHHCYSAVKIMAHFSGKHTGRQTFINPLLNQQFNRWTPNHIYTALNWGHSVLAQDRSTKFSFCSASVFSISHFQVVVFFILTKKYNRSEPVGRIGNLSSNQNNRLHLTSLSVKANSCAGLIHNLLLVCRYSKKDLREVLLCWYFSPF